MSNIFYSQVNSKLKKELDLRASAGKTSRGTKELNYMLSKITNVELIAYKGDEVKKDQELYTLGGSTTRQNDFLPSGEQGYLTKYSTRPGPVITGCTVNIADNAQFQINTSTINLLIQDPDDLNLIEETFFKPGRVVKLVAQYHKSGILSEDTKLATDEFVTSYRILRNEFQDSNPDLIDEFFQMDRVVFTGLINSFNLKYNEDVTISVTLNITATAGTYPSAEMFITNPTIPTTTDEAPVSEGAAKNFYEILSEYVNNKIDDDITEREIIIDGSTDKSILHGRMQAKDEYNRLITVGLLIDRLNEYIGKQITNNTTTKNPLLFCNDQLCFSNYYEHLVSANPARILLWPGTNDSINTDKYTDDPTDVESGKLVYPEIKAETPGYYSQEEETNSLVGHPSRIYINMQVINEIVNRLTDAATEQNPFTVKKFLKEVSFEIGKHTGFAIYLALIQHPELPNALLYYDTNYLGNLEQDATFTIPVFSREGQGTIVRDFKLDLELPAAYKTTLLGFGGLKAPTKNTSYNPWLFSDTDEARTKSAAEYKTFYTENLNELNKSKLQVGQKLDDTIRQNSLQKSLVGYIAYPTSDITETTRFQRPIWPLNLEFTIDGINGFKYGDVLFFAGLPERYNDQFVFCIKKIKHTISDAGEWTTTISCWSRTRIQEV
jgi:hypothetical protein